ncbi:hypothetical protein Droror1_Dr00007506 [Drosera rotundifolia]
MLDFCISGLVLRHISAKVISHQLRHVIKFLKQLDRNTIHRNWPPWPWEVIIDSHGCDQMFVIGKRLGVRVPVFSPRTSLNSRNLVIGRRLGVRFRSFLLGAAVSVTLALVVDHSYRFVTFVHAIHPVKLHDIPS